MAPKTVQNIAVLKISKFQVQQFNRLFLLFLKEKKCDREKIKFSNFGMANLVLRWKGNCFVKKILLKPIKLRLFNGLVIFHFAMDLLPVTLNRLQEKNCLLYN